MIETIIRFELSVGINHIRGSRGQDWPGSDFKLFKVTRKHFQHQYNELIMCFGNLEFNFDFSNTS